MDKEIKPKNRFLKKAAVAAAGAAIVAAAIYAVTRIGENTYKADADSVTIAEVTSGIFNDCIRLNGRVETGVTVQVSALETGIVDRRWVEEGAMVKEGDIILTLHNPNLRQQILDSESQLAEKQNMLRDTELAMEKERLQVRQDILSTRTDYSRKQRIMKQHEQLYKENLCSREEYLQAREDCELARRSLALLQERLSQDSLYRREQIRMMRESLRNMQENFSLVRQRADNLNVRASHSGQLGNLTAELGQNISAGQQIGQINILDDYKIAVKIDEHYIDRVEPGLKGRIERNGAKYDVVVSKLYPEVTDGCSGRPQNRWGAPRKHQGRADFLYRPPARRAGLGASGSARRLLPEHRGKQSVRGQQRRLDSHPARHKDRAPESTVLRDYRRIDGRRAHHHELL